MLARTARATPPRATTTSKTPRATTSPRATPPPTPRARARVAASANDDEHARRLQQLVRDDAAREATKRRYVARESGERRGERVITGFWQTFAEKASDARKRHFDGRKTIDGKASKK